MRTQISHLNSPLPFSLKEATHRPPAASWKLSPSNIHGRSLLNLSLSSSHPSSTLPPTGLNSTAMKFIKFIHPNNLFRFKKSQHRHIAKSAPASFNTVSSDSSSSSSSSSSDPNDVSGTNTRRSAAVPVRPRTQEMGDWSDVSASGNFGDGDFWSELVEAFRLIDRDSDGKITRSELEKVLSRIGAAPPSEEELKSMLAEIDYDGDGCISLEELGAISSAFGQASGMEELQEAFEVFDADCDGRISAEELLRVLSATGDERCTLDDCRRMIEGVDVNKDGFVCFEDFRKMMERQSVL